MPGVEDAAIEITSLGKENVKSKKLVSQNIQVIWDIMKRQNLKIIRIGEESQHKYPENTFN